MTAGRRNLRILVVDDDSSMVATLRDILVFKRYAVDVAHSSEEAIESAKRRRPDCILMDIRMPGMNGFDTFRQIRQLWPAAAVIFMSAFPLPDVAVDQRGEVPDRLMAKPLDLDCLLRTIEHITTVTSALIVDDDSGFYDTLT